MRRLSALAVLALAAVTAWPSAAGEPNLTTRNSLVAGLGLTDSVNLNGVGCGGSASAAVPLPAGASDVRVARPTVGARNGDARLTAVSVQGNSASLTAVADSADICDPNATPNRPWSAVFEVEAAFKQRVMVMFFNFNRTRGKAFPVRPREVQMNFAAAARRIRWRQFGARKAVGLGVFKSLIPCAGGCTDNGTRLSVEMTRPIRCAGFTLPGHKEDVVIYRKYAFVLRERLSRLRRGTEWMSDQLDGCPGGTGPRMIPIR